MTGNKQLDKVLIILTFLMSMLAASTFVYTEIFYERPEISNETEFEKLKNESSKVRIPKSFKLKKMIIKTE